MPRDQVLSILQGARVIVLPSTCYENFPMTIAQAYSCGTPIIATRLVVTEELVLDGRSGLRFTAGQPDDLAAKINWAFTHPEHMRELGDNWRSEYQEKYTAERNYKLLLSVFHQAIQQARETARCGVQVDMHGMN